MNNIKNVFEEEFNVDKNHKEILSKIENNQRSKRLNTVNKFLIASCVVIMFVIISPVLLKDNKVYNNNYRNVKDIINYNILDEDLKKSDILYEMSKRVKEIKQSPKNIEKIEKEVPFLSNINISKTIRKNTEYEVLYQKSSQSNITDNGKQEGLLISFFSDDNLKAITIFVSKKITQIPSCYLLELDKLKESTIKSQKVKLIDNKNNNYRALFKYDNFNIDIQATNISKDELITLITSIIKWNNK